MKVYFSFTLTFAALLFSHIVCGQSENRKKDFPSYNQIKPKADEIMDYDYVSSDGKVELEVVNLFDYPPGTVTYIVNGKSFTNVKNVKKYYQAKISI